MNQELKKVLHEFMDLSDNKTIKKFATITEAGQSQFLVALTGRLYDKIQEKVDNVDFSAVSGSRGDITKIPHYDSLTECLDIIRKIVIEYKQPTVQVDVVLTAIENLKTRKAMFMKAFAVNSPMPILTYNSIALAIVQSVTLLIATSIEFIKNPGSESFEMALDVTGYNKTRENLLFNNLQSFNKSCQSKELDRAMDAVMDRTVMKESIEIIAMKPIGPGSEEIHHHWIDMHNPIHTLPVVNPPDPTPAAPILHHSLVDDLEKPDMISSTDSPFMSDKDIEDDKVAVIHDEKDEKDSKSFQERGFLRAALGYLGDKIWLGILNSTIPLLRSLVYQYNFQRQKASDWYQLQADMLAMNKANLQYNNSLSDSEKKSVARKQQRQIDLFKKRANALQIDMQSSAVASEKLSNAEATKFKAEELEFDNDNSDDNYNSSSLF